MNRQKTNYPKIIQKLKEKGEVFPATMDSIFKSIIQDEELKDYTAFLISSCNGRIINEDDIVFVNTEGTKKTIKDKINVKDILIDIRGNRVSMEMNKNYSKELNFRNLAHFYEGTEKIINISYRQGRQLYYEQINFNDFNDENELISTYKRVNIKTGREDPSESNFVKYQINLALIHKKYYTYGKELTRFEKALAILSFNKVKDLRKIARGDEMLMRVVKKIEEICEDPDLVEYIDVEKGMAFGHRLDIEEAAKEASEKAAKEARKEKSIEIAKKMLNKKMNIQDISEITNLDKTEIDKIKKEITDNKKSLNRDV